MNDDRPLVDAIGDGDQLTHALLGIVRLADEVSSMARPALSSPTQQRPASSDGELDRFHAILLGIAALGDQIEHLSPAPSPTSHPDTADALALRPRDLLR